MLSRHAQTRCQQRGVTRRLLSDVLDHADIDRPVGNNCRQLRVSRKRARELNHDDRLGRLAVIWSDDNGQVVTVMPVHRNKAATGAERTCCSPFTKGDTP